MEGEVLLPVLVGVEAEASTQALAGLGLELGAGVRRVFFETAPASGVPRRGHFSFAGLRLSYGTQEHNVLKIINLCVK